MNTQVGRSSVARIVSTLKIEWKELEQLRKKAQLAAEHWSSLVSKKLVSNVAVDDNDDPYKSEHEEKLFLPVNKGFKPKYGLGEVESGRIQYAAVLITHVIHPNLMYIQIEDQDLPLYHQMNEDLQQEFRKATKQSPSYCSSPLEGK